MTDETEIDVDELRSELDQIKDAMGIRDRYPSLFHMWLAFAVLVLFASIGSQAVVTYELPDWGHAVSWFGFMGIGSLYQRYRFGNGSDAERSGTKPSVTLVYGAVVAYLFAVLLAVGQLFADTADLVETSVVFALIIGAIGTGYLVQGNLMKAYYIRSRDRYAFYVGGAWMLAYAAVLPNVTLLREWGYVVYGVLFAVHGVGSYLYLSRERN